jgi:hypothetical protein
MNIEYFKPFSDAWERMKRTLFQPFDIGKWFALGFCVFLANLLSGGGSGGSFPGSRNMGGINNMPDIRQIPGRVSLWLHMHPFLAAAILAGVLIFIGLLVLFTWLSSRGVFMFLDNVVQDRHQVALPWRKYRNLGSSLFLWRIGFGIVVAALLLPLLVLTVLQALLHAGNRGGPLNILFLVGIGFIWFAGAVIAAYVSLFTKSFVVPIMYKNDWRILQAWSAFLSILKNHPIHFILYGLFVLLAYLCVGIAAIVAGCVSCCIGFIVLALPYINCVILLPVHFTLRAFSLEFLAQWGEDYSLFTDSAPDASPVPPPPVPPPAGEGLSGL